MNALLGALNVVVVLAYPFAVYLGLTRLSARAVGLMVAALIVAGLPFRLRGKKREHWGPVLAVPLTIIGMALLDVAFDDPRFVLALPVITNVALLAHFGGSLRAMPIVERFARAVDDDLTPAQVRYCRSVTQVWCVFFVLNGAVIAALALVGPLAWWAAYSGGVAYGLVGVLASAEYVVRKYRFRKYGTGLHDRVLSRIFPPRAAEAAR